MAAAAVPTRHLESKVDNPLSLEREPAFQRRYGCRNLETVVVDGQDEE